MFQRYVAIGDSFTEGVGDEHPDGTVGGWADFTAAGLAAAAGSPIGYANLAVRGRKLRPLLDEQLETALGLGPDLLSLNGGGNDILRPSVSIDEVADALVAASRAVVARDVHMLLISGADPTRHLPGGALVRRRGERLAEAVRARRPRDGVTFVDNWADAGLADGRYWSADRMHMNVFGHLRVASNVLSALGLPVPDGWAAVLEAAHGVQRHRTAGYYRHYVLPWIGRRLTGRSSGDGRSAKHPAFIPVGPDEAALGEAVR